jgi:hypothetical protein
MAAKAIGGSYIDEPGYEVQFSAEADCNTAYFGRYGLAPTDRDLIDAGPGSSITDFSTCLEDMAWSNDSSSSGAYNTSVHDTGPSFTSPEILPILCTHVSKLYSDLFRSRCNL